MLPYSILDASSVSMKCSTIASLKIQQLWFSLEFFQLSAIVEWSNNTLAHAQNNDLRPFSNQFVFTCIVPRSDFRLVQVIRVVSATGMSETGMRWFFRPASCKQKQASLKSCRSDFSCKGRTIRKVMGGGGEKAKKKFMQGKMPRKKIRAKKKGKKKNSCRRKVQLWFLFNI